MKQLWLTLGIGGAALVAMFFITRHGVRKDFEAKFENWKIEFVTNYRTIPETVKVVQKEIVTKWLPSKPIRLTAEDSARIVERLTALNEKEKEDLFYSLMENQEATPVSERQSIGDSIHISTTLKQWYYPLADSKFGYQLSVDEIIYPRGGTSYTEQLYEEPLLDGLVLGISAKSEIDSWKFSGETSLSLPLNIGGNRKLIPKVLYDTDKRGFAGVTVSQKLF